MIQIITKYDYDPTEEFTGIWFNEQSGSLWVWADNPILLGFTKEGTMVRADVFSADFVFTPTRNKQKYKWEFDYHGIPMLVVASVTSDNFTGGEVIISFGNWYGDVDQDGDFIIAQLGNVKLGAKLLLECVPTEGSRHIDLTVLTYE